jgi:hypothetical protein
MNTAGITIWGTAIDTLENTSRFAKGNQTGPMTVLHVFNQPLSITKPYEGYIGNLFLPKKVVEEAADRSTLIDFFTPRKKVVEAIQSTYPGIKTENIHVWTLAGKSREGRIGKLWEEWRAAGVHLVDDEWTLPMGEKVFTESGTYAPTYFIGPWEDDDGEVHLFLADGYAASAEAIQASSLCPILELDSSLAIFSSKFELSYEREARIMYLDPESKDFSEQLVEIFGHELDEEKIERYRSDIRMAREAGIPLDKRTICVDDFLPEKKWRVMAISGYMLADPYTDTPGIDDLGNGKYRVAVRLSTDEGDKRIILTLRLLEGFEESRLVFNPLLNRFMRGEDYRERAVKISDSGRIRNELQTLCSEALEHFGADGIRIFFDRISPDVISPEDQQTLRDILAWYKVNHPIWFSWLEVA